MQIMNSSIIADSNILQNRVVETRHDLFTTLQSSASFLAKVVSIICDLRMAHSSCLAIKSVLVF